MGPAFGRVLRAPYVPWLAAASVLARLPYGVDALATLLYVRDRSGSFTIGGLVSAATAVAAAVSTPVLGRLVDRAGQSVVLAASAIVHLAGVALLLGLGEAGAPTVVLAGAAALAGVYPPLSQCLRGLWPLVLDRDERSVRTALAFDAILLEAVFIGGPLLAAAMFALASPGAALVVSVVLCTAGTLAFAAAPPSRSWRGEPHGAGPLGPLVSPGMRTLLMTSLPLGAALGALEVALPAFGVANGAPGIGGVAIACLALGSACGGLVYGSRVPADVRRAYVAFIAAMPFAVALLAVADSTLALLVLAPLAGALLAPLTAAENELAATVAPTGTVTEAYSWIITATVAGIAVGTAVGGSVVEASSWRTALLVGGAIALVSAAAAALRHRTLVPYRATMPG